VTIQDLIARWCTGIAFSFHWVKGHADRIDRPLTRDERLNIEADIQADAIRAQACGTIAARPNCPHCTINSFYVANDTVVIFDRAIFTRETGKEEGWNIKNHRIGLDRLVRSPFSNSLTTD
jgi:hypothetical protein